MQVDPEFNPELDLVRLLDPMALDLGLSTPNFSQRSFSPRSPHASILGSVLDPNDTSFQGLMIPPSASSVTGGPLGSVYASATLRDDDGRRITALGSTLFDGQDRLEEPGFHFDDHTGDLIFEPLEPQAPTAPMASGAARTTGAVGPQGQPGLGPTRTSDTLVSGYHAFKEVPLTDKPVREQMIFSTLKTTTTSTPTPKRSHLRLVPLSPRHLTQPSTPMKPQPQQRLALSVRRRLFLPITEPSFTTETLPHGAMTTSPTCVKQGVTKSNSGLRLSRRRTPIFGFWEVA